MKTKKIILGIITTFLFLGCSKDDSPKNWSEEINLTVASQYVDYYPFGNSGVPIKGISIKEEKSNEWVSFHEKSIKDFEFTEGYEYNLKVLKIHLGNPPEDDFSFKYELLNIISKTKK